MPPLTGFQNIFHLSRGFAAAQLHHRATICRPWPGLLNSVRCAHINEPHKLLFVGSFAREPNAPFINRPSKKIPVLRHAARGFFLNLV